MPGGGSEEFPSSSGASSSGCTPMIVIKALVISNKSFRHFIQYGGLTTFCQRVVILPIQFTIPATKAVPEEMCPGAGPKRCHRHLALHRPEARHKRFLN